MADALLDSDQETEEELAVAQRWAKILYSLVFGKQLKDGVIHYPILLMRDKDESTD